MNREGTYRVYMHCNETSPNYFFIWDMIDFEIAEILERIKNAKVSYALLSSTITTNDADQVEQPLEVTTLDVLSGFKENMCVYRLDMEVGSFRMNIDDSNQCTLYLSGSTSISDAVQFCDTFFGVKGITSFLEQATRWPNSFLCFNYRGEFLKFAEDLFSI